MSTTATIQPQATPFTKKPRTQTSLSSALTLAKPIIYRDHLVYPDTSLRASTRNPPQDVRDLSWSPLGTSIAVADSRVLRVWAPQRADVKDSIELKPPASEATKLASASSSISRTSRSRAPVRITGTEKVVWNPAAEAELASLGSDGSLRLWDVRTRGQHISTIPVASTGLGLAWRPAHAGGDEIVATTRDDKIVTVSRRGLSVVESTKWHSQLNPPVFSNSGDLLLLPALNGRVEIVSFPGLEVKKTINAHPSPVNVVAQDPRGRHLTTAGSDSLVSLWDTGDFTCRQTYPNLLSGPARSVSFSFDSAYLVAGDESGGGGFEGLSVLHVETGEEVCKIVVSADGKRGVSVVRWHPGRYWLAFSGGREGEGGLKVAGLAGGVL